MLLFSFLDPVGIQKPSDMDLKWGKYSLITLMPLFNSVISYLSNFTLFEETIFLFTSIQKISDISSFQSYFFRSGIDITDPDGYFITHF